MDRKLEDKMNIALTREERMLLWNLIGAEIHKLENETPIDNQWQAYMVAKIKKLKVIEILIIG
jgi:hypothetical protein